MFLEEIYIVKLCKHVSMKTPTKTSYALNIVPTPAMVYVRPNVVLYEIWQQIYEVLDHICYLQVMKQIL